MPTENVVHHAHDPEHRPGELPQRACVAGVRPREERGRSRRTEYGNSLPATAAS